MPQPPLDSRTLAQVILRIEARIADLDRRGPPGARGVGCVHCQDAELHRLLAELRELASTHAIS